MELKWVGRNVAKVPALRSAGTRAWRRSRSCAEFRSRNPRLVPTEELRFSVVFREDMPALATSASPRFGKLVSNIVKLQALEEELPNGLHDALLRAISIDVVGQAAELDLDIWVGDLDSETVAVREAYRPVRIRLSGLVYLIVDPPGPGYTSLLGSPLRIDLCDPDPGAIPLKTIPDTEFAARIFVSEWNSFIRFAARDVDLQWLT